MAHMKTQKHRRFPVVTPVAVMLSRSHVQRLETADVSLGGLFIKTTEPCEPGSEVRLKLDAAQKSIVLHARVVHVIPPGIPQAQLHVPGMGVEFESPSPVAQQALQRFVDGLAQQAALEQGTTEGPRVPALGRAVGAMRQLIGSIEARLMELVPPVDTVESAEVVPWYRREAPLRAANDDATPETALEAQLRDLLQMASDHEQRGDVTEARQTLLCAWELAPGHPVIGACLDMLDQDCAQEEARRILAQAPITADAATRDQIMDCVRRAIATSPDFETRNTALSLLVAAQLDHEAVGLARSILRIHGDDDESWKTLLVIHERHEDWILAGRAADALLRLNPLDVELAQHCRRLHAINKRN